MIISTIAYHHHLSFVSVLGILVVFVAVGIRMYCDERMKAIRKRQQEAKSLPV
jgi:adenosine 3'-phospho 5'-phosphosulfate transporter B2